MTLIRGDQFRHELIVEASLRAPRASGLFARKVKDRRFEAQSVNALPPQVVRLNTNSPVTTLHLLQKIYDDGELRADRWAGGLPASALK